MATYIILWNWTDEGIRNVKKSPERVEEFRKTVENAGGKLESFYYTMGEFDGVEVVEAPTDEVWMKIAYSLGTRGSVRTHTLKAMSFSEAVKIMGQM